MSIQQELSAAITAWLSARPGRSLNMLKRLTTTSYSSVRRAAQGEVEQEQSTVVSIASVVMSDEQLKSFLTRHYPSLEKAVIAVKGPDTAPTGDAEESAIIDFLKSDDHSKLLVLANSRTGTNDEEVARKFGENSLAYFKDIKDSGILRYQDGNWFFEGSVGNVSLSLARKVLCNLAREFDVKNDSTRLASYSYVLWDSFNDQGIEKIYSACEKFGKEVYDIKQDQANHGDKLLVFGILHNVIKGQEDMA